MTCKCGKVEFIASNTTGAPLATITTNLPLKVHTPEKCDGYWELKAPSGG